MEILKNTVIFDLFRPISVENGCGNAGMDVYNPQGMDLNVPCSCKTPGMMPLHPRMKIVRNPPDSPRISRSMMDRQIDLDLQHWMGIYSVPVVYCRTCFLLIYLHAVAHQKEESDVR